MTTHATEQIESWPHCDSDQVQVMLLGTYHMDDPGLDEINVAADDVLEPSRQAELRTLTERLSRWEPDRIAVERPYDRAEAINELYGEYRAGDRSYDSEQRIDPPHPARTEPHTECRSEIVQIGFRLADELGHDRVHPIDCPMDIGTEEFETLESEGFQPDRKFAWTGADADRHRTELTERLASDTIPEYHQWLNQPAQLRFNHTTMFGRFLRWGRADNFGGPGILARWYERNLRMAHNCWRAVQASDERLLLIVGSGHVRALRHVLTESPMFCPVSPLPYL